jgi:hypothetical protein
MEKNYKTPSIVWLKVTDYMHGWLQYELGCEARVRNQRVVCVQHLPGARKVLRMETAEDMTGRTKIGNAMSATRMNCIIAGLDLDEELIVSEYGIDREAIKLFAPIECPKMCLTKNGVLRPWTLDICFGKEQASAMQRLLRQAFWDAVAAFDRRYAAQMGGEKYPAVDMIEAFCKETETCDVYVDAMRREWQRRVKRERERV